MDRKTFIQHTLLGGLGIVALPNAFALEGLATPPKVKKTLHKHLLKTRILEPTWPGRPSHKLVGFIGSTESVIERGKFYAIWYKNLICFTNGKPLNAKTKNNLSKLGIAYCEAPFIQINEHPGFLSICTAHSNTHLDYLYKSDQPVV